MTIEVLGTGCPSCQTLEARVKKAIKETGSDATVDKAKDMKEIVSYGVKMHPDSVVTAKSSRDSVAESTCALKTCALNMTGIPSPPISCFHRESSSIRCRQSRSDSGPGVEAGAIQAFCLEAAD